MESATVPILSFVSMVFTLIVMVGAPVAALLICARGQKVSGIAVLAGILGFVVMQLVIRVPMLGIVQSKPAVMQFAKDNKWLYIAALAVTASLFEGVGRLLTARFLVKPKRYTQENALLHGVGHGGIECLTIGAMTYINNVVLAVMINTGTLSALSAQLPPETLSTIVSQLTGTPAWLFLISGFERVMTISIHIGLSVLAFDALKRGSLASVLLMFLLHGAVDFIAPGLATLDSMDMVTRTLLSEGVVLLFAIVCLFIAVRIPQKWKAQESVSLPAEQA